MAKNPNAVALGRLGGKAKAKPTACPRCGEIQPTARKAWMHCRKSRSEAAKESWATRKPVKKAAAKKAKKK